MKRGFAIAAVLLVGAACQDAEERRLAQPIDQALRMVSQHDETERLRQERQEELGAAFTVSGKVTSATEDEIVLEPKDRPPLIVRVDSNTSITVAGRDVDEAEDIPVGTQVRVSLVHSANRPVATRIEDSEIQPVGGKDK